MLKKVLDHGNPLLKQYNKFVSAWNRGSSSTHHNREEVDIPELRNLVIDLRNDERDDLADKIQALIDKEEGR